MRRLRRTLLGTALLASVVVLIPHHAAGAATTVGPKTYYLALGDSLAYGFQPDLNFTSGYADDFFADLQPKGTQQLINMGCPGETSSTFLNGGCPYQVATILKYPYVGPQKDAALQFIAAHPGQISPVTLDIGANDVLPLINTGNPCSISSSYTQTVDTVDSNVKTILSLLRSALKGTGDLFMMNYYFPFQNQCPNLVPYAQLFNAHLAADARAYGVPIANVFGAFGGPATPNPHICNYTWMCSVFGDIHATSLGYTVIAKSFEATAGY